MHAKQDCWMELARIDDGRICKEYQHLKSLPTPGVDDSFEVQQAIISVDAGRQFKLVFSWRVGDFSWYACDGIKITIAIRADDPQRTYVQASWHALPELRKAEARAKDEIASIEIDCIDRLDRQGKYEEALTAPAPEVYDLNEPLDLAACRRYQAGSSSIHASVTRGKLTGNWHYEKDIVLFTRPTCWKSMSSFRPASQRDWEAIPDERFRPLRRKNGESFMFVWTNVASDVVAYLELEDWTFDAEAAEDNVHSTRCAARSSAPAFESEDSPDTESSDLDGEAVCPRRSGRRPTACSSNAASDRSGQLPSVNMQQASLRTTTLVASAVQARPRTGLHDGRYGAETPDNLDLSAARSAFTIPAKPSLERRRSACAPDGPDSKTPKIEEDEDKPAIRRATPLSERIGTVNAPFDLTRSSPDATSSPFPARRQLKDTKSATATSPLVVSHRTSDTAGTTVKGDAAREKARRIASKKIEVRRRQVAKRDAELELSIAEFELEDLP